jgi:putative transposase
MRGQSHLIRFSHAGPGEWGTIFRTRSLPQRTKRSHHYPGTSLNIRGLTACRKASKRRAKQVRKIAKLHTKIARQRKEFHHKTAVLLLRKYEVIAHENLNIKGLARTRLAKLVHDAGWGAFITILAEKAEKAGCLTIGVNPSGTTQMCSDCDAYVPKTLSDRWHSCPYCGLELDRDENSGRNALKKAEGAPQEAPLGCHPVFKARGVRSTSWTVKREARTPPRRKSL